MEFKRNTLLKDDDLGKLLSPNIDIENIKFKTQIYQEYNKLINENNVLRIIESKRFNNLSFGKLQIFTFNKILNSFVDEISNNDFYEIGLFLDQERKYKFILLRINLSDHYFIIKFTSKIISIYSYKYNSNDKKLIKKYKFNPNNNNFVSPENSLPVTFQERIIKKNNFRHNIQFIFKILDIEKKNDNQEIEEIPENVKWSDLS